MSTCNCVLWRPPERFRTVFLRGRYRNNTFDIRDGLSETPDLNAFDGSQTSNMAEDDVDIGSLTDDQQLALQQFTSVTDQELAAAIPILQKCEWNVQVLITLTLTPAPGPRISY